MIDLDLLTKELKRDEGFRGCAYHCSADKLTIGYGHNIEDNPIPEKIANDLLQHDYMSVYGECTRLTWFNHLDDVRKRAIVNMAFNIGVPRMLGFRKMIAAINEGDYHLAAKEMLDSKWAEQVGSRAARIAHLMDFEA